jgi:phosphoribosylamine--glycine ligase
MKILVVGGGAREHAIAWKLCRERDVSGVVCAPGNPGVAAVARCVAADPGKPAEMLALAEREAIDLTVVGPELPLSLGIVDYFTAHGRAIVGPTKEAAALEWSKAFAKDFMARHRVPTAGFRICDSADAALAAIGGGEFALPIVGKADGRAAGQGVVIGSVLLCPRGWRDVYAALVGAGSQAHLRRRPRREHRRDGSVCAESASDAAGRAACHR